MTETEEEAVEPYVHNDYVEGRSKCARLAQGMDERMLKQLVPAAKQNTRTSQHTDSSFGNSAVYPTKIDSRLSKSFWRRLRPNSLCRSRLLS
jgi:hypothetical protein